MAKNNFVDNEIKIEKMHIHTQNKSRDNTIKSNSSTKSSKNIDKRLKNQNSSCKTCLPNSSWYEE